MIVNVCQEYRAKKRASIRSRVGEQVARGHSAVTMAARDDLAGLLDAMATSAATGRTKGSRFTQIEKLQFAQVRIDVLLIMLEVYKLYFYSSSMFWNHTDGNVLNLFPRISLQCSHYKN